MGRLEMKKTRFQNCFALYYKKQKRKEEALRLQERRAKFKEKDAQAEKIVDKIADDDNLDETFSNILKGL